MQNIKLLIATAIFLGSSPNISAEEKVGLTESKLSESQIRHAESWALTNQEYKRYLKIMKTPRAYFTPNLENNPLLALALESDSEEERSKYADRWVKIQYENNIKVFGWQLEVNEAWARNYPGQKPFVYKKPGLEHQKISSLFKPVNTPLPFPAQKPRAQLYISVDGCEKCTEAFAQQFAAIKKGDIEGVDVQFVGEVTKEEIIGWAVKQKLSPEDVNENRIVTLNVSKKKVGKVPHIEHK